MHSNRSTEAEEAQYKNGCYVSEDYMPHNGYAATHTTISRNTKISPAVGTQHTRCTRFPRLHERDVLPETKKMTIGRRIGQGGRLVKRLSTGNAVFCPAENHYTGQAASCCSSRNRAGGSAQLLIWP